MSFDAHVECACDNCGVTIDDMDPVYCEACFNGESDGMAEPEDAMAHCKCGAYVPVNRMVEKIGGLKCRKCAKKYEQELMAQSAATKPVNGSATETEKSAGTV